MARIDGTDARGLAKQQMREAHVQRVERVVAEGLWSHGTSDSEYAKTHGLALSTVQGYAAEAHRRIAAMIADTTGFRNSIIVGISGVANVAKKEFHDTRDPAMGTLAISGLSKLMVTADLAHNAKAAKGELDAITRVFSDMGHRQKIDHLRGWIEQALRTIAELEAELGDDV